MRFGHPSPSREHLHLLTDHLVPFPANARPSLVFYRPFLCLNHGIDEATP